MSRVSVKVGQVWMRNTPRSYWKVKVTDANRSSVTYQVIEMNGEPIEHAIPITITKELFLSQFERVLK